jgi:hypothetical protein
MIACFGPAFDHDVTRRQPKQNEDTHRKDDEIVYVPQYRYEVGDEVDRTEGVRNQENGEYPRIPWRLRTLGDVPDSESLGL